MKTVILGNGILAATTALRLAQRAAPQDRIVIAGRATRPGSASLAAAAMLNSFAEVDEGGLEHEVDLFKFELSHLSTRMWPRFIQEIMEAAGSRLPPACANCEGLCGGCYALGTYVVNNNAADDLDDRNFDAIIAALKQFDEPHEFTDPRSIPNYAPEQRFRATRALYIPNEGWVNPRLILEALDAALAAYPFIEVIDSEVDVLRFERGLVSGAILRDGREVSGDKYLLATGATTTDILDKSGAGIPVQRVFYGVGVSVQIHSPEYPHTKCVRTPNRGLACGLYSVPFYKSPASANESLVIGASNFISPVPWEFGRVISVQSLLKGAMEQINTNFYRATVERINVGWRPTSSDTFPLLGTTSIPNLVIATGTKRDGFHLSPALSLMLAAEIRGDRTGTDPRYAWFAPERKLIRTLTREQAISRGVRHLISASYQHGFTPSHGRLADQMEKLHREELERLHDRAGATDWGIPAEMFEMYRYGHVRG